MSKRKDKTNQLENANTEHSKTPEPVSGMTRRKFIEYSTFALLAAGLPISFAACGSDSEDENGDPIPWSNNPWSNNNNPWSNNNNPWSDNWSNNPWSNNIWSNASPWKNNAWSNNPWNNFVNSGIRSRKT